MILTLLDFTPAEIGYLLDLAAELKAKKCAFEVAGHDLGMGVTYLGPTGSQMGKKNPSPTPPGCWAGCTTASNTGATPRHRRAACQVFRRAGLERADQRIPPHPDTCGPFHHSEHFGGLQGV